MAEEYFPAANWFNLLAYSVVALAALLWQVDKVSDESSINQWCVSAVSISIAFSALAVIANVMMRAKFARTAIEGGLAFLLLCFWAAVMPYLMTPANNLAVTGAEGVAMVSDGNLYFFSWFSLVTSFLLWFQYLRAAYKVGGDGSNKDFSPYLWAGVCMASFVVMVAAVRVYQGEYTCAGMGEAHCKRTKFAISLGTISAFMSTLWLVGGSKATAMVDVGFSVLMLILWAFGVSYITFGDSAPGAFLGNLYFGTWISFILVLSATSAGLRRMFMKEEETTEATQGGATTEGEVKIEKQQEDSQTGDEIKA